MKKQVVKPMTREQKFAEKASKGYAVCLSQTCSLHEHCHIFGCFQAHFTL